MRKMKALTLTILTVSALSVAMASSASAAVLFHASKLGTLKGAALNTQEFVTGAGTVECTKAASSGKVTALLALTQLVLVQYSSCKAFGFAEVKITPADYLFDASTGLVFIDNTITIEVPLGGCSVTVPPQNLFKVGYDNKAGKLVELSSVTGIHSTGSGGLCGGANTTGTYSGSNEIELEGGTLAVN